MTIAKSLGITIDDKLEQWSSHIYKLKKNVASGIGAIKLIRYGFLLEATSS